MSEATLNKAGTTKSLFGNIGNLFKLPTRKADVVETVIVANPDERQQNETYVHYGTRICGKVNASEAALGVYLNKVYSMERKRQAEDEATQDAVRNKVRKDINNLEASITQEENNKDASIKRIEELDGQLLEVDQQKEKLREDAKGENKEAKLKRTLGIIILVPLTLYLFVFYSSTFYSAFFTDMDEAAGLGLAKAMFNSQAIPQALQDGLMELLFILCAPVIFLGLGFALHFFAVQKGWGKYVKMGAVLLVTFTFDCILAYNIGKLFYDIEAMNQLQAMPPYSISLAVADIKIWTVIFCGFIVYMIWGIVFDMTWTAQNDIRTNASQINALELEKDHLLQQKKAESENLTKIENKITGHEAELRNKKLCLTNTVMIDYDQIKAVLNDFVGGWMVQMNTLECSSEQQNSAKRIHEQFVKNISSTPSPTPSK